MAVVFFFQAEDGIRDLTVTGVQTCALPILQTIQLARPALRRLHRAAERAVQAELSACRLAKSRRRLQAMSVRRTGANVRHGTRSEERRVGKEWRARSSPEQ